MYDPETEDEAFERTRQDSLDDRVEAKGRRSLRIVAAAVQKHGKVYEGQRHANIIPVVYDATGERVTQDEQGFVASDGKFYNRFQAGAIAYRANQTSTRKQTLLSEDLW